MFQGLESLSPQLHASDFRRRVDGLHLMKIFIDFRRGTTPICPLNGCLSSEICRVRSVRLATALLMPDGANPASMVTLLVFVGLITACDHYSGFIQCRVRFICMDGALSHRATILRSPF